MMPGPWDDIRLDRPRSLVLARRATASRRAACMARCAAVEHVIHVANITAMADAELLRQVWDIHLHRQQSLGAYHTIDGSHQCKHSTSRLRRMARDVSAELLVVPLVIAMAFLINHIVLVVCVGVLLIAVLAAWQRYSTGGRLRALLRMVRDGQCPSCAYQVMPAQTTASTLSQIRNCPECGMSWPLLPMSGSLAD